MGKFISEHKPLELISVYEFTESLVYILFEGYVYVDRSILPNANNVFIMAPAYMASMGS